MFTYVTFLCLIACEMSSAAWPLNAGSTYQLETLQRVTAASLAGIDEKIKRITPTKPYRLSSTLKSASDLMSIRTL